MIEHGGDITIYDDFGKLAVDYAIVGTEGPDVIQFELSSSEITKIKKEKSSNKKIKEENDNEGK